MKQDAWVNIRTNIVSDGKEWRTAHPKATCVDIEEGVHRWIVQVEAHLLGVRSARACASTLGKGTRRRSPNVFHPGRVPLHVRGPQTRTSGTCPNGGESVFPLDEERAVAGNGGASAPPSSGPRGRVGMPVVCWKTCSACLCVRKPLDAACWPIGLGMVERASTTRVFAHLTGR